ncbi:MAG: carbohydrate ABC transporter permease [Chloroflexi bacterium]|nr:carbohydrate ABC transporter permease [Chloroflexota bacterium]
MKRNTMRRLTIWGQYLAGLLLAILFLLPLYWVFVASLRQPGLPPPTTISWWPLQANWGNYREIFRIVPMSRYIKNSLIVAGAAVPLTLLTASLAGFSMSQMPDKPRRRLLAASVALLIVPASSVWMFRFQILRLMGLIDSLWALIIPAFAASSPLFVLLFYWTFRRLSGEMIEAARLDGASAWTIWRRLAFPLARPTAVAVTILTFIMYWNDFVSPVLYIYRPKLYTAPIGLQILNQVDSTNWPLHMAAAALMTLPIIILLILLQRYFLSDLSLANVGDGS